MHHALISTLPKSGTWYCHTFFWCYEQLLSRSDDYLLGKFTPDLAAVLSKRKISNRSYHRKTLGIDALSICHTICPGFEQSDDTRIDAWKALQFPLPANWGERWLRRNGAWKTLTPSGDGGARIVYLYRNPLDHFVSYWNHAQTHVDEHHRTRMTSDGKRVPIKDLHEFIFEFGMLGSFIKHYYSFRQMQHRYPEHILMMPYERLTQEPQTAFYDILTFLGASPDNEIKRRLFTDALTMCSKESLSAIEKSMDSSIAGDQSEGGRHIRDGGTGKWERYLTRAELEAIEAVFNAFDISLNEFILFKNATPLSWLGAIDSELKQLHRQEFFRQQRNHLNSGMHKRFTDSTGKPSGSLPLLGSRIANGIRWLKKIFSSASSTISDEVDFKLW